MFAIEMLAAGHGDALIVEWGPQDNTRRLLIDAGTYHSWPDVRARLLKRRHDRYEVFVVTHVDEDHIGGAIALLDDPDLRHRISHIWFNGFVHCKEGGNVLGPVNGEQLTDRIVSNTFEWNIPFKPKRSPAVGGPVVVASSGDLPVVDLPGGARAVLLSPSGPKLKRMAETWRKDVVNAGLVPGEGDVGHNQAPRPHTPGHEELPAMIDQAELKRLTSTKKNDGSAANGSSIAMVIEHDGKRLLLAGDAHASVLAGNLKRYGQMIGEDRPRIDLFKLSHHGSVANLSQKLLEAISVQRFLVSSNGDNFGHPDDEAIARATLLAPQPTFYCNYSSTRTEPWVTRGPSVGATFKLPKQGKSGLRVTV